MSFDINSIDGWTAAKWVWGLLVSLLTFLGLRQLKRIDKLEESSVNRAEWLLEQKNTRADRLSMHRENKALLDKIDCKLDSSEIRRARVEHEITENIHTLAIRVEQVDGTAKRAEIAANNAASAASGKYKGLT